MSYDAGERKEMLPGERRLGAVLAGGRAERFGGCKARAPFLGEPLVIRAVRMLEAMCEEVVVVTGDPEIASTVECDILRDRVPDAGPLAGLHASLFEALRREMKGVILFGCDMPLISPELLSLVGQEGLASDALAVVPAAGPKGVEPLCAWYRTGCLDEVERRLLAGQRSLRALLSVLGARRIPPAHLAQVCEPATAFRSANTKVELRLLEAMAAGPSSIESLVPSGSPSPMEATLALESTR